MREEENNADSDALRLPKWLTDPECAGPIVHLRAGERNGGEDASVGDGVQAALAAALNEVHHEDAGEAGLIKVHIGEPKCTTRMRPAYAHGAAEFLCDRGAESVVSGDTTVAYTGRRGHKSNPPGDASTYRQLAREQGWSVDGPAAVPFVVLDRPSTSRETGLDFDVEYRERVVSNDGAFHDFHPAGGFLSADCTVNFAHLTLHGLAGVAGCVKSIAMGCAALPGKLRMHQSLRPVFDEERCTACGLCVENCPENALALPDDADTPIVDPASCIGCGECEAVCAPGNAAVRLEGETITDWERGQDTLPVRMADYAVGLMNGRWEDTVHVLHMYDITERCDCLNMRQEPMTRDLGFLVGKNPFAIDRLGGQLLRNALEGGSQDAEDKLLRTAEMAARQANETFGITEEVPVVEREL